MVSKETEEEFSANEFAKRVSGVSSGGAVVGKSAVPKIRLIGAGLSRTGTQSLKRALELLNFTCYNLEVGLPAGHNDLIKNAFVDGDFAEWEKGIRQLGCDCTLDNPVSVAYKELFELNSDAKVLLSVRDTPEAWFDSMDKIYTQFSTLSGRPFIFFMDWQSPRVSGIFGGRYGCVDKHNFWEPWYMPWVRSSWASTRDRQACIEGYKNYIEKVQATIPAKQLLVFNVKEGWGPLTKFLGVEAPANMPFPHVNSGNQHEGIQDILQIVSVAYPVIVILPVVIVLFVLHVIYSMMCKKKKVKKS